MFNHLPEPDEILTMDEAGRAIAHLAKLTREYPRDTPYPVSVTLSDEQWVSVMGILGTFITHAAIEDSPTIFPAIVIEDAREAMATIYDVNIDLARHLHEEEQRQNRG